MARYIDADEFMSKFVNEFWSAEISFSSVDDIIEKLVKKVGDVTPVIHAKITIADDGFIRCSACNKTIRYPLVSFNDIEYCPRCGAKIDNIEL